MGWGGAAHVLIRFHEEELIHENIGFFSEIEHFVGRSVISRFLETLLHASKGSVHLGVVVHGCKARWEHEQDANEYDGKDVKRQTNHNDGPHPSRRSILDTWWLLPLERWTFVGLRL